MKIKSRPEEYYVELIKDFFNKNNRWPFSYEIPSVSRAIQRRYGGLVSFREKHNLGNKNYSSGEYRSNQIKNITKTSRKKIEEVYSFLTDRYGKINIHRKFMFTDDSRCYADFCIFTEGKQIIIDCISTKDINSFKVCLQSKIIKYKNVSHALLNHSIVHLNLNEKISSDEIKEIIQKKDNPLPDGQSIMNLEEFDSFWLSTVEEK